MTFFTEYLDNLKEENVDLKESVDGLAHLRDQLRQNFEGINPNPTRTREAVPEPDPNSSLVENENEDLKEFIDDLAQRRDHFRARNARLMALNSLSILEAIDVSDTRKLENPTRTEAFLSTRTRAEPEKAESQLPTPY